MQHIYLCLAVLDLSGPILQLFVLIEDGLSSDLALFDIPKHFVMEHGIQFVALRVTLRLQSMVLLMHYRLSHLMIMWCLHSSSIVMVSLIV